MRIQQSEIFFSTVNHKNPLLTLIAFNKENVKRKISIYLMKQIEGSRNHDPNLALLLHNYYFKKSFNKR